MHVSLPRFSQCYHLIYPMHRYQNWQTNISMVQLNWKCYCDVTSLSSDDPWRILLRLFFLMVTAVTLSFSHDLTGWVLIVLFVSFPKFQFSLLWHEILWFGVRITVVVCPSLCWIRGCIMSLCLRSRDVSLEHLVKVPSATFLHGRRMYHFSLCSWYLSQKRCFKDLWVLLSSRHPVIFSSQDHDCSIFSIPCILLIFIGIPVKKSFPFP